MPPHQSGVSESRIRGYKRRGLAGRAPRRRNAVPGERNIVFGALSLEGKVAVITGGTSGIGKALAIGLAEAGADVVPCSRRLDAVEQTVSEIERRGRRSVRVQMD